MTLGDYLQRGAYSPLFVQKFIVPITCAICTCSAAAALAYPADIILTFGLPKKIQPVHATQLLDEKTPPPPAWAQAKLLHVPGHCPGSLCLYLPKTHQLFGGDVLFADGVGRWDLPGGSRDLLITGIQKKILPLPPQTTVYPGHGPTTTVGREASTNPFLQT